MTKQLPKRPNLDHLRRQAKALLSDLHRGDAEAARTFIKHLPEAAKLTVAKVRGKGYRLADAQSAIARKTGFASWPSLSRHVQTLRMLEGDWRFESLEIDGRAAPRMTFSQSTILIDGDCFRTESPEANYEGVFIIDVDAKPPHIDIEFVEGPEAGNCCYGLFKLDGDHVTFCLGLAGSSRPMDFVTSAGSGHALERLRRATAQRPASVTGGRRASASKPGAEISANLALDEKTRSFDTTEFDGPMTPAMKRLQGEWIALELVQDGQKMRDDWLPYGVRRTEGSETKVVFGGQTMLHAKMRVDETTMPITVDYLNLAGAVKGKLSLGILEWHGEVVTFHVAPAGKPRPTGFTNEKGSGGILSRWRKKP